MHGRKITEQEYAFKKTVMKTPAIKVLDGNTKVDDPFLKIAPNTYRWFVLIPKELISELNWNKIFRTAHKARMIKIAGVQENPEYQNYDLANGSLLFAFK